MNDLTIGQGIVLLGYFYLFTTVVGILLTRYLDRQTLKMRLESEERQAKTVSDITTTIDTRVKHQGTEVER